MTNKAIYKPTGKAGEYAKYACNFYIGCSIGCSYCYNKTGRFASTLGGNTPTLKKCFKNETDAFITFSNEVDANLEELQKHGIFFSFTTDPMLPETKELTISALDYCHMLNVPIQILTKNTQWIDDFLYDVFEKCDKPTADMKNPSLIAFGVSISGDSTQEPGASTEWERTKAIIKLHYAGFKTFISFEPAIIAKEILNTMNLTMNTCDLYRIGLGVGTKKEQLKTAVEIMAQLYFYKNLIADITSKIYLKDSFLKALNIEREDLDLDFLVNSTHTPFSSTGDTHVAPAKEQTK